MRYFIIIHLLTLSLSTKAQEDKTSSLYKKEIIQFFKDIRVAELTRKQMLVIDKPVSLIATHITFYSSKEKDLAILADTALINRQIDVANKWVWDSTLIESVSFIEDKSVKEIFKNNKEGCGWKTFYDRYGEGKTLYSISIPIFSTDTKYCIIQINFHCGDLCGQYCLLAFKRVGGVWTKIKELECSVS